MTRSVLKLLISPPKTSSFQVLALGLVFVAWSGNHAVAEDSSSPSTGAKTIFYASGGPWGRLRCTDIHLEAPSYMVSWFAIPGPIPRWSFPSAELNSLAAMFRRAGMSEDAVAQLMSLDRIVKEGGYVHLFPPVSLLESMAPETRLIVYTKLANHSINSYHADPVLIVGETVEEFFATSDLSDEMVKRIERMCYKRGGTLAFSDPSVLIHYCENEIEVNQVMKAMTRTRSLMIRLELDVDSDVDEIVDYWTFGDGVRKKDIEPIIRSIIETRGLETLPLAQVLPPLARKLIYTYPGIELAKHGVFPDCHWTSLNFLNYEAHEYLLDADLAALAVVEGCEKVERPYRYGDILMFVDKQSGRAIHSCVHLADDIVYTKNGRNILSPWILAKLSDVVQLYMYKGSSEIQGYRRFSD